MNNPKQKRPNFLVFIFDDLNMQVGCFGKPYVQSPHIDSLAQRGTRFERAYVQHPVCAASRSSFLTGMYPETTGVGYPYSHYFIEEIIPKYGTLSQYFFRGGYYTRHFGKIHHGFEETVSEPNFHPKHIKYHLPENEKLGPSKKPPFERADAPDSDYVDCLTADAVVAALGETAGANQPFFFGVGLLSTHLPHNLPSKYWALYDSVDIPLSATPLRPNGIPSIAIDRYNLQQYRWEHADPDRLFSDDYARTLRQAYLASVSFADAQIGKVLAELERQGLIDNTVVVLLSDHGYHLGEQNHWGKTTLYEASLNSPLIISAPGISRPGSACRSLVEYVDVLPTLLDIAGLPILEHVEGVSLVPLLDSPQRKWRKAARSRQTRGWLEEYVGRSIRTEEYRYSEWRNILEDQLLGRELYDLSVHPGEVENFVNEPAYAAVVAQMSQLLDAGWESSLPDGVHSSADNPPAPPPYAWGPEGDSRREQWHKQFGGDESEGWRKATKRRLKQDR